MYPSGRVHCVQRVCVCVRQGNSVSHAAERQQQGNWAFIQAEPVCTHRGQETL